MRQDTPQIPLGDSGRPAKRNDDFIGVLPNGVFPTPMHLLEQGGHFLIVKSYEHGRDISKVHRRMYRLLTTTIGYSNPDSPGSVTVICVWGLGPAAREWVVFDAVGETDRKAGTREEFRTLVSDWFYERRKIR
jgi:hypothetical protein